MSQTNITLPLERDALGVAGRVWADPRLRYCDMDVQAAKEIAIIVERVLKNERRFGKNIRVSREEWLEALNTGRTARNNEAV